MIQHHLFMRRLQKVCTTFSSSASGKQVRNRPLDCPANMAEPARSGRQPMKTRDIESIAIIINGKIRSDVNALSTVSLARDVDRRQEHAYSVWEKVEAELGAKDVKLEVCIIKQDPPKFQSLQDHFAVMYTAPMRRDEDVHSAFVFDHTKPMAVRMEFSTKKQCRGKSKSCRKASSEVRRMSLSTSQRADGDVMMSAQTGFEPPGACRET